MNTYYQNNNRLNSNNDIFEEYFFGGSRPVSGAKKAADHLLALLSAFLLFITSARVRTVARVTLAALSLVGFVGIIGAVEVGTLGMGAGALLGLLFIGLEVLCLYRK